MKRFLTLLALCLLAVACNDASRNPVIKGYRIHQVGGLGFGLDGLTADMNVDLDIDNPAKARYTIEAFHADVFPAGDTVRYAVLNLKEPATVLPKSSGNVEIPLGVRLLRPLSLLGSFLSEDLKKYEADVDLTIRKGAMKKTIRKSRVPLDRILELLGQYEYANRNETETNE